MENVEDLTAFLQLVCQEGLRGRLLYRGAAWSLIRKNGKLPPDSPTFGAAIESDLAEYGFSLLRAALSLREKSDAGDSAAIYKRAFELAGNAFESLTKNASEALPERGFYSTIAGASYHLAGYSAIAFSIFSSRSISQLNLNSAEISLILLIMRDLDGLRKHARKQIEDVETILPATRSDTQNDRDRFDGLLAQAINVSTCRAMAIFDFALQTGEGHLVQTAKELLHKLLKLCENAQITSLWWIIRLMLNLIDDLWQNSLHERLPKSPPSGGTETYSHLRRMYIASLYGRKISEVELWPSQIESAVRASDVTDDLVAALPTSAGKTRIAEIAALVCLSTSKRVLIVTPLRALSAQTERSFRRTFTPLGFSTSSLYGASGFSATDEDVLNSNHIVIATPEKLDFALRSDPHLIDNVGLIVLDEGHMIGPSEREIRYEILVQRLLRRTDADARRLVCLSAILPTGEELNDLTAWIRSDSAGGPIRSNWRPTRQRYGSLIWYGDAARLNYDLDAKGPFVARFIEQVAPKGREKNPYPRDKKDLTIFAAWQFANEGKRVLIFITQANWVQSYAEAVINLRKRGYLDSLVTDLSNLSRLLEIGKEWLGENHPVVKCLEIGVAIHYGALPNPFLRELELSLSQGQMRVIIASPTLSQGLNLNAGVLLVPTLFRNGEEITPEELANVAGRAGRAFVDTEGLIIHTIFEDTKKNLKRWERITVGTKYRTLKSGLFQVISEVVNRLIDNGMFDRTDVFEYLCSTREAWRSPQEIASGNEEDADRSNTPATESLEELCEKLDAIVTGLIDALDAGSDDLPRLLDEALQGSLWARQIARESEDIQEIQRIILNARAKLIWASTTPETRKGHHAMGLGLEAGLAIDALADNLLNLLIEAEKAAELSSSEDLTAALGKIAEQVLTIRPFAPDKGTQMPINWREILKQWITGIEITQIGATHIRFIEDALTYRLVWAMEALRMRYVSSGLTKNDISGKASALLETGVYDYRMSMLIRAGLPSRNAAVAAIKSTNPTFSTFSSMREWLESEQIQELSATVEWPTKETASLWNRFRTQTLSASLGRWEPHTMKLGLNNNPKLTGKVGELFRAEINENSGALSILTPDFQVVARLSEPIGHSIESILTARIGETSTEIEVERLGPLPPIRWNGP